MDDLFSNPSNNGDENFSYRKISVKRSDSLSLRFSADRSPVDITKHPTFIQVEDIEQKKSDSYSSLDKMSIGHISHHTMNDRKPVKLLDDKIQFK